MITHRRVYQGKPGNAQPIVAKLKEYEEFADRGGNPLPYRIFTDRLSGATDRVVLELEAESIGQLEQVYAARGNVQGYAEFLKRWQSEMMPLIEGAFAEMWRREV
ncbi:MAG: hypothetical protein WD645_03585 [Dehalococcoidia bacterium]